MTNERMALGKVLKEIRLNNGLTQETLAFESGVDRSFISLIERGDSSPTFDTIVELCKALDINFTFLAAKLEQELQQGNYG